MTCDDSWLDDIQLSLDGNDDPDPKLQHLRHLQRDDLNTYDFLRFLVKQCEDRLHEICRHARDLEMYAQPVDGNAGHIDGAEAEAAAITRKMAAVHRLRVAILHVEDIHFGRPTPQIW